MRQKLKMDFLVNFKSENEKQQIENWIDMYGDLQDSLQDFDKKNNFYKLNKTLFRHPAFLKRPLNKIGEPSLYLIKKQVFQEVGFFSKTLKQSLDFVFCYRLLKKHDIIILKEKLVSFRIHSNQATNVNRKHSVDETKLFRQLLLKEFSSLLSENNKLKLLNKEKRKLEFLYLKFLIRLKNKMNTYV